MLSENNKQNPSEIHVPQKPQINRKVFLEHYLNKNQRPHTLSYKHLHC